MNKEELIKHCKVFDGGNRPDRENFNNKEAFESGVLSGYEYDIWCAEAQYISYVTNEWVGGFHTTEKSMEEYRATFISCGLKYSNLVPKDLEVLLFNIECRGQDPYEEAEYYPRLLAAYIGLTSIHK